MQGYLDTIYIVYLDNILIYSASYDQYVADIYIVLDRLRKWKLYTNLSKYEFFTREVEFLRYIVGTAGISMDKRRVVIVDE